jgi:uncharacterized membrane protein
MTGSLLDASKLVGWGLVIYSVLYMTHERLWNKVNWARVMTDGTFVEKQHRSWAKNFTWKMIILCAEWTVGMIVTQNNTTSLKYAFTVSSISLLLYWMHERFWNKAKWGRQALANGPVQTVS